MKITKTDLENKQEINTENYLMEKKYEKRVWKKQISKYV